MSTNADSASTAVFASPQEPRYASAVASYNLAAVPAPAVAAVVRTREEAGAAVAEAIRAGQQVRVVATGHSADSAAPFDGQALIRTEFEEAVVVDSAQRTVTIPAGARWDEVIAAAARFGLAAPHGSSGTVSAIGYLLGGGMSFYGRTFGVASNAIANITLLAAGGNVITVDDDHDRELFWALRGGGGGFGIVLSVTLRLFPAETVHTGAVFFSGEDVAGLLEVWDEWARTAPRSIGTSFRIMNLPPLPHVPEEITRGPVVCVDGVAIDTDKKSARDTAEALLARLSLVAQPLLNTWHPASPAEVAATHMDPPDPLPIAADHFVVAELPGAARSLIASFAEPQRSSHLTFIELRQLGGAFAENSATGGAVDHFTGDYAVVSAGVVPSPDDRSTVLNQLAFVRTMLKPWDTGFTVPTAVSSYEAPQRSFDAATAERVEATRRRIDPEGVFRRGVAPGSLADS